MHHANNNVCVYRLANWWLHILLPLLYCCYLFSTPRRLKSNSRVDFIVIERVFRFFTSKPLSFSLPCACVCCYVVVIACIQEEERLGRRRKKEEGNLHCNRLNIRSFTSFSELNFNLSTSPPRRLKLFSFIISAFYTRWCWSSNGGGGGGGMLNEGWDLRVMSMFGTDLIFPLEFT